MVAGGFMVACRQHKALKT